jgi:hypothetical protein
VPLKTEFQEKGHIYRVGGVERPSVTQIIQHFGLVKYPPSALPFLKKAGERGTLVHAACDLLDVDMLDWNSVGTDIRGYVQSYMRWKDRVQPVYARSEYVVTDGEVCGRIDREWDTVVADLKTAKIVEKKKKPLASYRIQLAAYDDMLGGRCDRLIIHLDKDGKEAKEVWCEDPEDYDRWREMRNLYLFKEREGLL